MEMLCRLCMNMGSVGLMEPIFRSVMGSCIAAKVVSVTQLTLYEGDGLPGNVCQQCIFKLDVADAFIQQCTLSDKALKAMQALQKACETPIRNEENSGNWRYVTDQTVDPLSMNASRAVNVSRFGPNVDLQKDDQEGLPKSLIDVIEIEDYNPGVTSGAYVIDNSNQTFSNPLSKDEINNSRIQESKQIEHFSKTDYPSNYVVKEKDVICSSLNSKTKKEVSTTSLQPAVKMNNCDICQTAFSSKGNLARHAERLHAKKSLKPSMVTKAQKANIDLPGKGVLTNSTPSQSLTARSKVQAYLKFPCTICKRTFRSQISLKKHFLSHSATQSIFSCEFCPKTFAELATLNRHKAHHPQAMLQCNICKMRFVTKTNLTSHILLHYKERPYACPQCGKRFTTSQHMSVHMLVHSDERPHKCTKCSLTFKRKSHLARHMKRLEAGQKCARKRRSKNKLPKQSENSTEQVSAASEQSTRERPCLDSTILVHEVVPENLFPCLICGQNFSTITDHKSHMQGHKDYDETLYLCKVCGQTFRSRPDLESHIPSHDVCREFLFPCKVCGRRFTSEASVAHHMSIHVRAVRHKCPICTRCFQTNFALKEHVKFHEEGCQFMCSVCNESFTSQEGLQSHLLSHANEQYVDNRERGEFLDTQPPQNQV